MEKINCSVGILTFNAEKTLARALESVKNFAEIIVCDGGSSDNTLNIANRYGCKILLQDKKFKYENNKLRDFSGVRNQMLAAASLGWFLYVDSDEWISEELAEEIGKIVGGEASAAAGGEAPEPPAAFWVPRKYVVGGKEIDCASTYPSKQMRFFHKSAVNKFIKEIHERIEVKSGASVKTLKNFMLVEMESDVKVVRRKWDYYIGLELERRGKISARQWFSLCAENAKISALFAFRFVRNLLFCRGEKMPFALEMERHRYHFKLCQKFFGKIKIWR